MNTLIIDISETCLRAVLSNDGVLEYCRTFDFEEPTPLTKTDAGPAEKPDRLRATALDNPYLIYSDTAKRSPWDFALRRIIRQIRSEIKSPIDSSHLIIPSEDVAIATHQLPKMPRQDAEKLIGRKIRAETKEEFPPFAIIPAASDQKTQTWCSLYIPTSTLRGYHKAFSFSRMRLRSITTPVNAMIDAFSAVREAIFNTHAVFEIQRGFIEAFYISADGILHFQRLAYASSAATPESNFEEAEKIHKLKIFKIINTIFIINSNYQTAHPGIPVQMAWVCGLESGLDDIATALKDAMGIEVGIAPAIPAGLPEESGYVPLAGFAAALQSNSATTYAVADLFQRFPLRRTSSSIIFAVTACAALLTIGLTEREYHKLQKQVQQLQQPQGPKPGISSGPAAAYAKDIDVLTKLVARPFVFYNLFRELATELPDGVFLENIQFHQKDDKGLIDITALARLNDAIAENSLLTRFMAMLDRSPNLKSHHEPAITFFARDKERYLRITVTSEVNSLDSSK